MASLLLASVSHAATFTVDSTSDISAPGSPLTLREALIAAAEDAFPDTIVFDPALNGQTIVLNAEIPVNDIGSVIIDASSLSNGITINGGPNPNRIFFVGHAVPTSLTLRRLTLTGGDGMGTDSGFNGVGGAIHNRPLGNLILENCTLTGNTVGGAIYNAGSLTVTRCTLFANSASSSGGAIQNDGGTATLVQSTLSGNAANSTAGHIVNNANLILRHCTLTLGQADGGSGGIHNLPGRTTTLDRCIVTGNTAGGSPADVFNSGTFILEGASVIGAFTPTSLPPTGGGIVLPDPPPLDLAPLANNGGPTPTHALLIGSPAIDAGDGSSFTTDQRGKPKLGDMDIGAFEAQAGGVFALGASSHAVKEGDSFTVTVRRTDGIIGPASVRIVPVAGTATAADYSIFAQTLSFAQGETTKTVTIGIKLDALVEGTHSFKVRLESPLPTPASSLGTPSTATVTIRDAIPVTNANNAGPGSLRGALASAAAKPGADVIAFAPTLNGKTILVAHTISVSDTDGVTVDASNLSAGLTLDAAGGDYSLIEVPAQIDPAFSTLHLRGLTFTGLRSPTSGWSTIRNIRNVLRLTRCTVHGNIARAILSERGTTELTQCTISGNSTNSGGGINVSGDDSGPATLSLTHCTVSNNSASNSGGGVFVGPNTTFILNRSIILGNTAPSGANVFFFNNSSVVSREGTSVVPAFSSNGSSVIGSGQIVGDPGNIGLAPLANNGGPTRTHALPPGSPALNAAEIVTFLTDQRGRPMVGIPDVGSYEAQPGGTFVLRATSHSVNEGSSVTVTIDRTNGFIGEAKVRLFTTTALASAADFTGRLNTIDSEVSFADGDAVKTVPIQTTADSLAEANETFAVKLGTPSPGTNIGAPSMAQVVILDPSAIPGSGFTDDPASPGVPVITKPAPNAPVNVDVGGTFTVTGTVTDNKGVNAVTASLNGGAAVPLTLATPGASTTTFSGNVPGAVAGVNRLTVTASDFISGHNTVSTERTFRVLRPLRIIVDREGFVTPGYEPTSYRTVGSPHTITATPYPGFLFAGWSATGTGITLLQLGVDASAMIRPTLTFVHRENLTLRAIFSPNPYLNGIAGTYIGRGVAMSDPELWPYFAAKVETTGAFSGSVKLDGLTIPVAGAFDTVGAARFGTSRATVLHLPRPGKPSLTLALNINLLPTDQRRIRGTIKVYNNTTPFADSLFDAHLAAFSATNPVPTNPYLTATGGTATYSLIFSPPSIPGGLNASQVPRGTGYGTFTLSRTGVIKLVAKLADNTAITQTTNLTNEGSWPLYVQMYPGFRGLLTGQIIGHPIIGDPDNAPDYFGNVRWTCPVIDRQHYSMGWSQSINVDMSAAKYTPAAGTSVVPLADDPGTVNGNATLTLTNGLLTSPIAKNVDISDADLVTPIPNPDLDYVLKINRTTGIITGSFLHSDGTRPTFNGVIFQKVIPSNLHGAHGFFMTTTPKEKDYTGQSGNVVLDPQ